MSESPVTPEWHRLPHDGVGFFGLSAGFERRDLKRRYNELIRQFKPERFPQEFQRIRAAYEQLDLGLRYGEFASQQAAPSEAYQWRTDSQVPRFSPADASRPGGGTRDPVSARSPAAPLHVRVQTESVSTLYAELAARSDKTPFDYYSLAVMSDVVDRQDGLQFANWLLKGLAAHPGDVGLWRLVHEYVRGPQAEGSAARLLAAYSKSVGEDFFFPLTEPLWQLLVRQGDFAKFRETLAQCEANLKGLNISGHLVFTLQILKSAMWQADNAWIDERLASIESNFDHIPHYLEYDVEIIAALRAYMQCRPAFITGHPLRQQLDQALRAYFTQDQTVGDRAIIECQIQITQDTTALREALLPLEDPSFPPLYNLWSWISYDVAERHIEAKPMADETELWYSRARTLLAQMERQTNNSRLGVLWCLAAFGWYGFMVVFYLVLLFLVQVMGMAISLPFRTSASRDDGVAVLISVGAIIGSIFLTGWLTRKYLRPRLWLPIVRRMAERCYRSQWQPEVLNFLARSHVPYHLFTQFLEHAMTSNKSTSQWIQYHVNKDYALAVYTLAQRFII